MVFKLSKIKLALISSSIFSIPSVGLGTTILDLQNNKQVSKKNIILDNEDTEIEWINLNQSVNAWFILNIKNKKISQSFHIENVEPNTQKITFSNEAQLALEISSPSKNQSCTLKLSDLKQDNQKSPYVYICEKKLLVRHITKGRESAKEAVADFLRKNVWGGEKITSFVKDVFFKDKYKIESEEGKSGKKLETVLKNAPNDANISQNSKKKQLPITMLGIPITNEKSETIANGHWYKMEGSQDIFISGIEPGTVAKDLQESYLKRVSKLDSVESKALAFSIAFDLDSHGFGYVLGTDHPDVKWADRALDSVKDTSIPGPDGIGDTQPIVTTGKLSPYLTNKVISTFTGGFKRTHGAFKWGSLSKNNKGSHYGFIEQGVTFSTLQPGLSTIIITKNGEVILKTWQEEDNKNILPNIVHARQNGVPIVDGIEEGIPKPGKLVNRWGQGNWSGSAAGKQRSLRAGICLAKNSSGKRFLIYSYFSTITPSGMARVFQSYGCEYAMHMDMNALEHTYLATYIRGKDEFQTHNLIQEMEVLDSKHKGKTLPRFLGMADNRDFFYVYKK